MKFTIRGMSYMHKPHKIKRFRKKFAKQNVLHREMITLHCEIRRHPEMSLIKFQKEFKTEEDCASYLSSQKWKNGFQCPRCKHEKYYFIQKRRLYECQQCAHQTSVTAGTIMHKSKLPLLTWFWAIYLVVHDKRGRSALALSDVLEINYRTALRLLRKIREAMRAQDANYQLSGLVEMDDAYFGGRKSGTDGRGTGLYRGKC